MKKFLLFIIILSSFIIPQTKFLHVGNALQYDFGFINQSLCIDTISLGNKKYFLVGKNEFNNSFVSTHDTTYERIEGDSLYYIRLNKGDSLIFNFNWNIGKVINEDTSGNNKFVRVIDSIYTQINPLFVDTIYVIKNLSINLQTGDTSTVLPEFDYYSKALGQKTFGLNGFLSGYKINGNYYGEIFPFNQEIKFDPDSIFIETNSDSGSISIKNNSNENIVFDSLFNKNIYGYHILVTYKDYTSEFYMFEKFPRNDEDSLNIIIPSGDSIKVLFFSVDLCPICKTADAYYFKDTLRFDFRIVPKTYQEYHLSKEIQITGYGFPSDVNDPTMINSFKLEQNYPNPFNPSTTIQYYISTFSKVELKVFDILGREIETLVNEQKSPGQYTVQFNANNLASGVYFYKLRAGNFVSTKELILMK